MTPKCHIVFFIKDPYFKSVGLYKNCKYQSERLYTITHTSSNLCLHGWTFYVRYGCHFRLPFTSIENQGKLVLAACSQYQKWIKTFFFPCNRWFVYSQSLNPVLIMQLTSMGLPLLEPFDYFLKGKRHQCVHDSELSMHHKGTFSICTKLNI